MIADEDIATHQDPVWRERTNYIVLVDLATHGMPGKREQLWTRTEDKVTFELCCIPFFTYGFALGDRVKWDETSHAATLVERSGRRNVRIAWQNQSAAAEQHEPLHGRFLASGALVEFRRTGYAALDCADAGVVQQVLALIQPWADRGDLLWEYGDEPLDESDQANR